MFVKHQQHVTLYKHYLMRKHQKKLINESYRQIQTVDLKIEIYKFVSRFYDLKKLIERYYLHKGLCYDRLIRRRSNRRK
jgi:hypothetical protein